MGGPSIEEMTTSSSTSRGSTVNRSVATASDVVMSARSRLTARELVEQPERALLDEVQLDHGMRRAERT